MILFPLFVSSVVGPGGKCANILNTGGNLLPVSTTPEVPVEKFAAGVVDTGGKLTLSANLPAVLLTPVANLPLVSLILVVNLHLQISPKIFRKNRNDSNFLSGAWGKFIKKT